MTNCWEAFRQAISLVSRVVFFAQTQKKAAQTQSDIYGIYAFLGPFNLVAKKEFTLLGVPRELYGSQKLWREFRLLSPRASI